MCTLGEVKIAIVVFAGFSIKEVDALAAIFSDAPVDCAVPDGDRPPGLIFNVSLLSIEGGYVADSLSIQIWTERIEARLAEKFDGVFMVGAQYRTSVADDPTLLRIMSTLVARADLVVWDSDSALYRLVTASAGAAQRGRLSGSKTHTRLRLSMTKATVSFVVALAFTNTQARKQIETQILVHLASSRSTVGAHAGTQPSTSDSDAPIVTTSSAEWTPPITAGADWLRENYMHPISIASAAEVANMSERTFLRRFRAETSMTPSAYLLAIRLDVVCNLLKRTRLPVDTIARRCGMGSGERLAKIFRRRLALTPSEFRIENHRKRNARRDEIALNEE